MFYGLIELILSYFIISIPVLLISNGTFKLFERKLNFYSSSQKAHWLVLIIFAPLILIICISYNLQEPAFVSFCKLQHEFCLGLATTEKLSKIKYLDLGLLSSILTLLSIRSIKNINFNQTNIPIISSIPYKSKLENYLNTQEIEKIQVLDTEKFYAYCKGVFNPNIYLSRGLIEDLSPEHIHVIFLHEKAHIKRGDLIILGLFNLISIISVYPKLLSKYSSLWKIEKERACDDQVVRFYSPLVVAQTIIEVLKKSNLSPGISSGFACKSDALKRIERLTNYQDVNKKDNKYFILGWFILFISVISLFQFSLIHCSLDRLFLLIIDLL